MNRLPRFAIFVTVLAIVAFDIGVCSAGSMLFDRGLPTANLNSTAGANRSNVSWGDWSTTLPAGTYNIVGDDFSIGKAGSTYHIDTIRVWAVDLPTPTQLWGQSGGLGGAISVISTSYTATAVTYAGGVRYEGSSGSLYPLYQVDFRVNLNIAGGSKYNIYVYSPYTYDPVSKLYLQPFMSASNAALSGSTQTGADGQVILLDQNGPPAYWDSASDGSWDKSSDINLQAFGDKLAVPEPSLLLLLGVGVVGLAGYRKTWKIQKRSALETTL